MENPQDEEARGSATTPVSGPSNARSGISAIDDDDMTEINVDAEDNTTGQYISRLERMLQNRGTSEMWTPVSSSSARASFIHPSIFNNPRGNFITHHVVFHFVMSARRKKKRMNSGAAKISMRSL